MDASKDYMDNMFGASYVSQFLKKKKKKDSKDQEVGMSCSEHGCAAYDTGGGGSGAGRSSYAVKTSSGTSGESNKVLTKKQADRRAKEFEENRKKAPAMKNLTKNQQKQLNETRPSRADLK